MFREQLGWDLAYSRKLVLALANEKNQFSMSSAHEKGKLQYFNVVMILRKGETTWEQIHALWGCKKKDKFVLLLTINDFINEIHNTSVIVATRKVYLIVANNVTVRIDDGVADSDRQGYRYWKRENSN